MPARPIRTAAIAAAVLCAGGASAAPISWDELKAPAQSVAEEVELSGFLLPVDYEGDNVYQFVLLPWAGACSHTPPPPPNQVVLVTPEDPIHIERTYEPVSVTGHLRKSSDISQLFILDGVAWVESGYRIRSAHVQPANIRAKAPPPGATPWKFLNK